MLIVAPSPNIIIFGDSERMIVTTANLFDSNSLIQEEFDWSRFEILVIFELILLQSWLKLLVVLTTLSIFVVTPGEDHALLVNC